MKIHYMSLSETGLERYENQDTVFCGVYGTAGIFLVADGMGGHENGAYASTRIKHKTETWWNHYIQSERRPAFFGALEELREVFSEANNEILENTRKGLICGSTLAALWIYEDAWAVISCGDSRCYQAKGQFLRKTFCQLTTDDVWENQPQNVQGMSRHEIEKSMYYGSLIRAVGVKPEFQCTIQTDQWKEPTVFVLCSDGIYKYCSEEFLKKQMFRMLKSKDARPCMEEIRNQVFQNGAWDNLSLIMVMVENKPSV